MGTKIRDSSIASTIINHAMNEDHQNQENMVNKRKNANCFFKYDSSQ